MDPIALKNMSGIDDVSFMRAWCVLLAQYLVQNGTGVRGVELFGSLARGRGTMDSDFDLIICVDGPIADQWMANVNDELAGFDTYSPSVASVRRRLALGAVKIDPDKLEAAVGIQPGKQDFFLFPADWRTRLAELQRLGRHTDVNFMQNIARDARTFVPDQGFPFPIFPRN